MTINAFSSAPARRRRSVRRAKPVRRGVVGVLSMMFMIIFGSLAVAMAIVSQGNLQTAQTQLRVNNAIGAADTGLLIAAARLRQSAADFRIEKGFVDADYAADLWTGTFNAADGDVLNAAGDPASRGIRDALAELHEDDTTVEIDLDYATQNDWLATAPIVLEAVSDTPAVATQITYIPLPASGSVRTVVTGYAWDFTSQRWVSRTVQQDHRVFKRVDHAILGPSKIMIGKNVQVNGPLGARFTGQEHVEGHPLVIRSDFLGLNTILDNRIRDLYEAILADDVDGDNRLRVHHAVESRSVDALNITDYDGDGDADNAFDDHSGDGAIDDFDLFLAHYDDNGDGRIILSSALTAGTPNAGQNAEFSAVDEELAMLIDSAIPDRDGNGVIDARDTILGYRDGAIDYRDRYAKVHGRIAIRTTRQAWEQTLDNEGSAVGDYQRFVEGAIRANGGQRPVVFGAGDDILPDISTDTFETEDSALGQAADGAPFAEQAGLSGAAYSLVLEGGVVVGQEFNASLQTVIEATPYGANAPADWYRRPIIRDRVFKDVVIPRGLNALFINCTFAGVTRVQSYNLNTHVSWQFYGQQLSDGSLKYPPPPADSEAQLDNDYFTAGIIRPPSFDVPRLTVDGSPYVTTKPLANNIRFHDCTFVGSIIADKPRNYTHIRNKLQFTGSTKFYEQHPDRPDDPDYNPDSSDLPEIEKSSMLLPHYSVDIGSNNAPRSQDVNLHGVVIAGVLDVRGAATINGALLLTFEPTTSDPALQHFGQVVGNPANFNGTLGYFGPDDGDAEGFNLDSLTDIDGDGVLDLGYDNNGDGFPDAGATSGTVVPFNGFGRVLLNWDPNLIMPDGLIAPIRIEPVSSTYREGRLASGSIQ